MVEGDEGTTDGVFTVRLSAPPLRTVTFDYATADGTATAGSDYLAAGGTLTFEVGGPIEQTVVVPVVGDVENESYETFTLAFSDITNALVIEQPGDIMITGDDGIFISAAATAPVAEGDSWETPWSRYIGDAGADSVYDMEVDAAGNTWLVGGTTSSEWAFGGYDTSYGGEEDGFVAKVDPRGELEWVGYLGGSDRDYAQGVAVDDDGNVWITGRTESAGWVAGGHQIVHGGGADAFVVKLDSEGELLWSSYLGGSSQDDGFDVAFDADGNAVVVGDTASSGWVSGGYNLSQGGTGDGFVAKLSPNGTHLWSSYVGSSKNDKGRAVAVAPSGEIWVAGETSGDGWISSGYDTGLSGANDGYVVRISADGQQFLGGSYLGGSATEISHGITLDGSGNAYIVGQTSSSGWITGGFNTAYSGSSDGFLAKLSADCSEILWSTYFASSGADAAYDVVVDDEDAAWVTGVTYGTASWVTGGFDSTNNGYYDAFVAKVASDGLLCEWAGYLGGTEWDTGKAIAFDPSGHAVVAGTSKSSDWTSGGFETDYTTNYDYPAGFLATIPDGGAGHAAFTISLSEETAIPLVVYYETINGSAIADEDYLPVEGEFVFEPGGPTEKTIYVTLIGDEIAESDEAFFFEISSVMVPVSVPRAEAAILNDDPLLSINDVEITEGDSGTTDAVFTVTLSVDPGETVTVDYATSNGEAIAGQDYQTTSGTLTFTSGGPLTQTVSVPIIGDTADETNEEFLVTLSGATNAEIADGEGTGTINNDDSPVVTVDDAFVWEGDDGTAYLDFVLHLSADPLSAVTVDYDTSDGSAVIYEDYEPAHGTITWQPGEPLDRTVSVPVLGDTAEEDDQTVMLDLSNVTRGTIGDAQAVGTIQDDEPTISIDNVKLVEGDSGTVDAVFTVVLDSPPQRTVTVDYATVNGTATFGEDYSAVAGTLTFEPGQPTTQTIAVPVSGDTDNETNETFFVNLTGAAGARIIAPQGLGTIVGDDGPLVSIADAGFAEGDDGTTNQAFTVTISADPSERVVVDYRTVAGTATTGVDYSSVDATLIFDPGQPLTQTILVPIVGDTTSEADETFTVELTGATVVGISDDEATGTIQDDDALISIDDVVVTEGVSGGVDMVFTVSISMDPPDTVTLDYVTVEGTAAEGTDYLAANGTLTFSPGGPGEQTITVTALGDIVNEIHETYSVELTNLVNANFTNDTGTGTITDDDGPKLTIDDVTVTEGDSGTVDAVFTVSLTEAATQTITVDWATSGDSALSSVDFDAASGTLTFEQGGPTSQQVTVTVNADTIDELDETFFVELSNATGAPILDDVGEGTIADDDNATLSIDDVTVKEGYNGWINSRTWQGTFWITPMTGESYHLMRISGAVAADDPWLVSGYDVGRFRFEVETMGVAAMTLQATGMEGAVGLSWAQDDFDLLAGYNVYRSDTIDGTYERLNETIIPVGQESYIDYNVTPAVPMYYQFTVVQTDNTESDPSNVASAAAVDTVSPTITHAPPTSSTIAGYTLHVETQVTDNVGVDDVLLYYRTLGSTGDYGTLAMSNISGDEWSANIPGSQVLAPGLEYYLTASDGINLVYDGTPGVPHVVVVDATPTITSVSPNQGPVEGGTTVTISGTLFQDGASVLFGTVPASNVTFVNSNQITCTAPAHFPAYVDVKVINSGRNRGDGAERLPIPGRGRRRRHAVAGRRFRIDYRSATGNFQYRRTPRGHLHRYVRFECRYTARRRYGRNDLWLGVDPFLAQCRHRRHCPGECHQRFRGGGSGRIDVRGRRRAHHTEPAHLCRGGTQRRRRTGRDLGRTDYRQRVVFAGGSGHVLRRRGSRSRRRPDTGRQRPAYGRVRRGRCVQYVRNPIRLLCSDGRKERRRQ